MKIIEHIYDLRGRILSVTDGENNSLANVGWLKAEEWNKKWLEEWNKSEEKKTEKNHIMKKLKINHERE